MIFIKLILISILTITFLISQESTPFVLDHADELIGKIINGETVRELKGNVSFHQGNLKVKCNYAIQYISKNELELEGNVRMQQDSLTLRSDKAVYFSNKKTANCRQNVELIEGATTIRSEYATYDVDKKIAKFSQRVTIISSKDDATITGDEADFNDKLNYMKIYPNAKLIQYIEGDGNAKDTLAIKSYLMESFNDGDLLIAKKNVLMARDKFSSSSGEIHFYKSEEIIYFYQKPILWYEENQITGDSIKIKLDNNKLQIVEVNRKAFAITPSDSNYINRLNQMTGQYLKISFVNDTIRNIIVDKNAISLYYIYENNIPNGVNIVTGDKLISTFKDGKIETINVKKGIEGTYLPEKILNREKTKGFLDGFKLHKNKPTIQTIINTKTFSN